MKSRQRGVTLSGLLMGAFVVAMLALLGMKVIPEYMEHRTIVSAIKKVASACKRGYQSSETSSGCLRPAGQR